VSINECGILVGDESLPTLSPEIKSANEVKLSLGIFSSLRIVFHEFKRGGKFKLQSHCDATFFYRQFAYFLRVKKIEKLIYVS
jgi:hypothetical protein